MQAEIHGRHGDEAALRVHDAVVAGEGEGAGAAEGVAGDARDGGVRVVEQGGEEGVEAVGVGVDVAVGFVEFESGAPEFLGLRRRINTLIRKAGGRIGGFLFVCLANER